MNKHEQHQAEFCWKHWLSWRKHEQHKLLTIISNIQYQSKDRKTNTTTLLVCKAVYTDKEWFLSQNFSSKLTPLVGEFPGVEGQIWVDSEQHVKEVRLVYTGAQVT